jgi:hypothetical protein
VGFTVESPPDNTRYIGINVALIKKG